MGCCCMILARLLLDTHPRCRLLNVVIVTVGLVPGIALVRHTATAAVHAVNQLVLRVALKLPLRYKVQALNSTKGRVNCCTSTRVLIRHSAYSSLVLPVDCVTADTYDWRCFLHRRQLAEKLLGELVLSVDGELGESHLVGLSGVCVV